MKVAFRSKTAALSVVGLVVTALAAAGSQPSSTGASRAPSAAARFGALNAELRVARRHRDWHAYQRDALALSRLLNDAPDALVEVARADVRLGDTAAAIEELRRVARLGVGFAEISSVRDFVPLRSRPDFRATLALLARNDRPHSRVESVVTLSDPRVLPEDLAYDRARHRFLASSALGRRIVTVDLEGRVGTFVRAPDPWPVLALRIDDARGIVWATEVALDGFVHVPKRDWGRSAVLAYDIHTARLVQRIEGPHPSQLGDMALAPDGSLLIGDSNGGTLYRLRRGDPALRRVDSANFISPMTPAFVSPTRAFVADYVRGIGVLDVATNRVRWLPTTSISLAGVDGLYARGPTLLAVVNGTLPNRLVALRLDANARRVVSFDVAVSGTADLDVNHCTPIGEAFACIENAGWASLDEHGNLKPGRRMTPATIVRVPAQ